MNEIERVARAICAVEWGNPDHPLKQLQPGDPTVAWELYVPEATAANAAMRGEPVAWQPIETAPKDGRKLILCRSDGKGGYADYPETFYWDGDWYAEIDGASVTTKPTHWMPLPTPPDSGKD